MIPTEAYDLLSYYTLSHSDQKFFIHQYIVDAFKAQYADDKTKPIALVFALVGLYLATEKNFTGKQIQEVHIRLAKKRKVWPKLSLPKNKGAVTVYSVLSKTPGKERDEMIKKWVENVWGAYKEDQDEIRDLLHKELDI